VGYRNRVPLESRGLPRRPGAGDTWSTPPFRSSPPTGGNKACCVRS